MIGDRARQQFILRLEKEYADIYGELPWITPEQADRAEKKRAALLSRLAPLAEWGFHGTKLDCRDLSPGCRLCGEGLWSCLFINNLCTGGCFFCPSEQNSVDNPTTTTLVFNRPADYVAYLETFGFRGASLSGGEPFLTLDRSIRFADAVKRRFGSDIHLWLYTNGLAVTEDSLKRFAYAGVDEIRFNIAATQYDLGKVRLAIETIPRVTVEIPAIPENRNVVMTKIHEMAEIGVDHLNLHQIRGTAYNCSKLASRGYSFLHGPRIGTLETELTALSLATETLESGIDLPINYCSLIFRNRFQGRGNRLRFASIMKKEWEDVTQAGYIRTITMEDGTTGRIFRNERNADHANLSSSTISLSYFAATVHPRVTYRNPYKEVDLAEGARVVVERQRVAGDIKLPPEEAALFQKLFILEETNRLTREDILDRLQTLPNSGDSVLMDRWDRIVECETIPWGLLEYF
ncbi:MAG: radical SAM protein [Deltaproteobacteria bacterium]|nr:radical SAM protein [Deltaproteobacteria bacterium]